MNGIRHLLLAAGLLLAVAVAEAGPETGSLPGDPEQRGRALAQALVQHHQSERVVWHQRMELEAEGRAVRVRELYLYRRNAGEAPAATLVRFSSPPEIAGTGLLSVGDGADESNQWVYLPARRMTRRVPTGRQGGRFAGSDFYYEDLRDRHVDLDVHRWRSTEVIDGREVELIESLPVDPDSSVYQRRHVWIDTERWLPLRIDFYRQGEQTPGKRYTITEVDKQDGRWVIMESLMEDLVDRHRTRLVTLGWRFDVQLPDLLFTPRALEDAAVELRYRP